MSAIASFSVVDRVVAAAVAAAVASAGDPATAYALLYSRSRSLDDDLFLWSGICLVELLNQLSDRGVLGTDLEQSDLAAALDDGVVAVFGPEHKRLLPRLDPAAFQADELVESMKEFDLDVTEATAAATDGLTALRTGIEALGDDDLLVITVG